MKKLVISVCVVGAFGLGVGNLQAQQTNEVEQLKKQVRQLQENFDRVQREHQQQIDTLMKKLDSLAKQQQTDPKKLEPSPTPAVPPAASTVVSPPAAEGALASGAKAWSPEPHRSSPPLGTLTRPGWVVGRIRIRRDGSGPRTQRK